MSEIHLEEHPTGKDGTCPECYSKGYSDAESRLERAIRGLEEIANGDWTITSGSIGPLMDVGYAAAGKLASKKARQLLKDLQEGS